MVNAGEPGEPGEPADAPVAEDAVEVPGDGFVLVGRARVRPGAPLVVVCHPHPAFGGRMTTPLVAALADAIAARGLGTLRFNFRGLDGSGGTPSGGHAEADDVLAALAWAAARGAAPLGLAGYSFGALMAARALAGGAAADAAAALAFPTGLVDDAGARAAEVERALDLVPWLLMSGDADRLSDVGRLAAWAAPRPRVTLEVLPGEGHFFAGPVADAVCARVAAFLAHALTR